MYVHVQCMCIITLIKQLNLLILSSAHQARRGNIPFRQHLHNLHPEGRPHQGGDKKTDQTGHQLWSVLQLSRDTVEPTCI